LTIWTVLKMQNFFNEVTRYLGYKGAEPDDDLIDLINDIYNDAQLKINPNCVYGTFRPDSFDFKSNDLAEHLNGAESIILFAATLGAKSEQMAAFYQKTDLQKAVIFDAVCNAYIERYCDDICAEIASELRKENKYINTRFSPGYGDFSIDYQSMIVESLNAGRRIGLSVNSSSLLLPQKSVTAVMGVFDFPPKGRARGCESCNMKDRCKMKGESGCSKTADSI
ncbi:MAG: hypothetical protein IJU45_04460, partial [Clostridia bacterium]|nr:hypothetical protein [Clostridia bacterium]